MEEHGEIIWNQFTFQATLTGSFSDTHEDECLGPYVPIGKILTFLGFTWQVTTDFSMKVNIEQLFQEQLQKSCWQCEEKTHIHIQYLWAIPVVSSQDAPTFWKPICYWHLILLGGFRWVHCRIRWIDNSIIFPTKSTHFTISYKGPLILIDNPPALQPTKTNPYSNGKCVATCTYYIKVVGSKMGKYLGNKLQLWVLSQCYPHFPPWLTRPESPMVHPSYPAWWLPELPVRLLRIPLPWRKLSNHESPRVSWLKKSIIAG